jgi:hypothetical protein
VMSCLMADSAEEPYEFTPRVLLSVRAVGSGRPARILPAACALFR